MGVPTSEVGYTSATTGREDHGDHKGLVVALGKKRRKNLLIEAKINSLAKKKLFMNFIKNYLVIVMVGILKSMLQKI
jgi:hypothetical protein